MSEATNILPVHGFVLVGGKSSRMGQDKATLAFDGRQMAELAVEKLRTFCAEVSLAGNREDLASLAPVVPEKRAETGPAAGVEAGLQASAAPWALFMPVDVPLVPAPLLESWAKEVLAREGDGIRLSYLRARGERQPAFCLLHRSCASFLEAALAASGGRLQALFEEIAAGAGKGSLWVAEAEALPFTRQEAHTEVEAWFSNVNTPEDLHALALWTRTASRAQIPY